MRFWLIGLAIIATAGGGFAYYFMQDSEPKYKTLSQNDWNDVHRKIYEKQSEDFRKIEDSYYSCNGDGDCVLWVNSCKHIKALNRDNKEEFINSESQELHSCALGDGDNVDKYSAKCIDNKCVVTK